MVQKKLPLINESHGSETRNIINELIKFFNDMGYTYDEALQKAHDALSEAKQANDMNVDVQEQIDSLIISDGESDAEVIQARGSSPLLKDRLDKDKQEVTAQFEHNEKLNVLRSDIVRYGKIDVEKDYNFPVALGFDLFRLPNGKVTHNFNFEKYTKDIVKVYISYISGSADNDGLSEETPVLSLSKALSIANSLPDERVNVVFMDKLVNTYTLITDATKSGATGYQLTLQKDISLTSVHEGGSVFFNGNYPETYAWTPHSDETYKVTRSRAKQVIDYKNKNTLGLPGLLKKVDSLSECEGERGTWYVESDVVYIHRADGSVAQPNGDELTIVLDLDPFFFLVANDQSLYVENIHHVYPTEENNRSAIGYYGNINSEVIINRCSARLGGANGFVFSENGRNLCFNSVSYSNLSDGFNYTGIIGDNQRELVFEYNCYSFDNGVEGETTSNVSTAHGEMAVLRVGTVGHDCYGPLAADVNGCYTVNIDCKMHDSKRTGTSASSGKTAFFLDSVGSDLTAKLYLINCEGGGVDTKTVAAGNASEADVFVKKLVGNNIPDEILEKIIILE